VKTLGPAAVWNGTAKAIIGGAATSVAVTEVTAGTPARAVSRPPSCERCVVPPSPVDEWARRAPSPSYRVAELNWFSRVSWSNAAGLIVGAESDCLPSRICCASICRT